MRALDRGAKKWLMLFYVVLSLLLHCPCDLPVVVFVSLLRASTYLQQALRQATISNMQLIKNDNPSLSAREGPSSQKPSCVMFKLAPRMARNLT